MHFPAFSMAWLRFNFYCLDSWHCWIWRRCSHKFSTSKMLGLCSKHGVQSAVPISCLPCTGSSPWWNSSPAPGSAESPKLQRHFTPLLVWPLGLKRTTGRTQSWAAASWHLLLPLLFSLLLYDHRYVSVEKGHLWSNASNTCGEYIYSTSSGDSPDTCLSLQNWNPCQYQAGSLL